MHIHVHLYLSEDILGVDNRGETIHRNYGESRFSGHDSVHDSFSPSFDTVRFTQV